MMMGLIDAHDAPAKHF